jgi:hypothetical protein
MTILVNAECHFVGQEQYLSGGRDFFESLIESVSRYAQEFLSQVPHPKSQGDRPELVQLHRLKDKNLHLLTLQPAAEAVPAGSGAGMAPNSGFHAGSVRGTPVQIYLTTVQLFDLVEAIDQFLADRRTLPDLGISLEPVSRRYRRADQPVAKRAAPAAVGVSSLALAAIAFFLVPIPQLREPKPLTPQPNSSNTTSKNPNNEPPTATPKPTSPSASDLADVLTSTQEITEPTELAYLERNLYKNINRAWKNPRQLTENLEYRVGVGKDGAIIGYKPVNEQTPIEASKQTPLPDLLYIPATGSAATTEPIAQFRIVFTKRGVLQVSPWRGRESIGKATLGPEITDSPLLEDLNKRLSEQLRTNWSGNPTYPKDLEYRVAVTEDGIIADYEPKNQPAWDYVEQTPLDKLVKPEVAGIGRKETGLVPQRPLAQFRVVFKQNGVLEVSPYRGY